MGERMAPRRWRAAGTAALVMAGFVCVGVSVWSNSFEDRVGGSFSRAGRTKVQRSKCLCRASGVAGMNIQDILCCPVSLSPIKPTGTGALVECPSTNLQYKVVDDTYIDLTPASGKPADQVAKPIEESTTSSMIPDELLSVAETIETVTQGRLRPASLLKDGYTGDRQGIGTSTFQNPLVSSVYERGWRQSFARAGFPGPDKEFAIAEDWLKPVAENGVLVDASCGSGLFTRRFVASGSYKQVIALDFSESMLRETATLCKQNSVWNGGPSSFAEGTEAPASPILVRGDIGRLPFKSDSIDGLHAGAAIHCWPSPSLAMTEISRVLKPGGRAVLSTFMNPQLPFTDERLRKAFFNQMGQNGMIRAWEEGELKDLSESVGLVNFECQKRRQFITFKVEKPIVPDVNSAMIKIEDVAEESTNSDAGSETAE
mmetsp:Transcript_6774/g.10365  ORF Transcript_6774/g.10365 Transcript_6774/m.10365 type:complete len:429 (+) Transcript_6774:25-1311(+)